MWIWMLDKKERERERKWKEEGERTREGREKQREIDEVKESWIFGIHIFVPVYLVKVWLIANATLKMIT